MILHVSTPVSWRCKVVRGRNKCWGLKNVEIIHTSVFVSVGAWPAAPVRLPSCFCWVKQELADPDDALWVLGGCSTGIWLWTWLWDWARRGSWHGFFLSSWSAVVPVPRSDPFCRGEENTAGWVSWAEGKSSGWLTFACCYKSKQNNTLIIINIIIIISWRPLNHLSSFRDTDIFRNLAKDFLQYSSEGFWSVSTLCITTSISKYFFICII